MQKRNGSKTYLIRKMTRCWKMAKMSRHEKIANYGTLISRTFQGNQCLFGDLVATVSFTKTFYMTSYLRHLPHGFRSLTIPQLVVCDFCPPCWPQLGFFASRLCIIPLLQVHCHTQGLCKAFRLLLCWAQSSPVQLLSQRLGSREQGNQP